MKTKSSKQLIRFNFSAEKSNEHNPKTNRESINFDIKMKLWKDQRKSPRNRKSIISEDKIKLVTDGNPQHHRLPAISPHSKLPKVFLNKSIKNLKRVGRRNNQTMLKSKPFILKYSGILKNNQHKFIFDKRSVESNRKEYSNLNQKFLNYQLL